MFRFFQSDLWKHQRHSSIFRYYLDFFQKTTTKFWKSRSDFFDFEIAGSPHAHRHVLSSHPHPKLSSSEKTWRDPPKRPTTMKTWRERLRHRQEYISTPISRATKTIVLSTLNNCYRAIASSPIPGYQMMERFWTHRRPPMQTEWNDWEWTHKTSVPIFFRMWPAPRLTSVRKGQEISLTPEK